MENLHDRQECRQIPAGFVIIVITFSRSVPAPGRSQFHINKKTRNKPEGSPLRARSQGIDPGLSFPSKRSVVGKTQSRQSWTVCKVGRRFYTHSQLLFFISLCKFKQFFSLLMHFILITNHSRSTGDQRVKKDDDDYGRRIVWRESAEEMCRAT